MIADYFGIENRQKISNICIQVRKAMIKDFVPNFLGARSLTREEWLEQNTGIIKKLFDLSEQQFAIVADGTYCYCQKSSSNFVQRKLYSGHKKRHLIKPFVITAANGKIIDVYGPFYEVDNDASIFLEILQKDKDLKNLLKKDDLAILDRGFLDCISELKSKYQLNARIPTCIRNKNQFSSEEANQTRLVTKCRYVVEVVNRIFKQQFKALDQIQNKMIPDIIDDYRIAASLINCFFSDKISDKNDWEEKAELMKSKLNTKNNLNRYLDIRSSSYMFTKIEHCKDLGFPKLILDQIRKHITFGNYQLEQAYGYLADHLNTEGDYEFYTCNQLFDEEDKKIIFTKIQSRHCNSEKYKVFVMFSPNTGKYPIFLGFVAVKFNQENIPKPGYTIKRYMMKCQNGSDDDNISENDAPSNSDLMDSTIKRSISFSSENQNNPVPYRK
ncbi:unnamed protein product [Brachionus calyciflorus]|uniref:DDE Tnp4 domain-containing protein n=1 Tax=Brachionus calyciflorus TaxID=104777 RepID=A0A814K643_9BILA|nr:unnamed protein product [Brachionus calyciflorus]